MTAPKRPLQQQDSSSDSLSSRQILPTVSWSDIELSDDRYHPHHHSNKNKLGNKARPTMMLNSFGLFSSCPLIRGRVLARHPWAQDEYCYYIKQYLSSSQKASMQNEVELWQDLYDPVQFPLQVHAQGDDFLVLTAWEETLRQHVQRLKKQTTTATTISLEWVLQAIAMPLIRMLKHLHNTHDVSYNILSLDSVGLTSNHQLVLIDLSQATKGGGGSEYLDVDASLDDASFDVTCWASLIRDVLIYVQLWNGLMWKQHPVVALLQHCNHEDPARRPKLLKLQKRLLELWNQERGEHGLADATFPATTNDTKKKKNKKKNGGGGGWWLKFKHTKQQERQEAQCKKGTISKQHGPEEDDSTSRTDDETSSEEISSQSLLVVQQRDDASTAGTSRVHNL